MGFVKSRFVIAFNDLSPIDLRRLCRMVTPTRLVAPYVVVIPLVGDSFQAQHLYQKEKSLLLFCRCFRLGPTRFCRFAFDTNSTVKQ